MKRMALTITAVIMAIMLSSCSEGKVVYDRQTDQLPVTGRTWTVLVYMCGGSSESEDGVFSQKLNDIMSVEYPENIKVLVETGGSSEWHTKGVYSDYMQRFEAGSSTLFLSDQSIAANMGNYNTLSDFISWGTSNYESDNYMLVLAGESGGSMRGMCYDELSDNDSLNMEEISYAMSVAGKNFDIVAMDASMMGSIETASALSTYADYLVAPQDVIDLDSWDYKGMLQYICDNPSAQARDIGKNICDTYYAKSLKNNTAKNAAMSLVDMSNVSTLNQAFDGMAGDILLSTDSPENYINMKNAIEKVHIYGACSEDEGYSDLLDLGDLAVKTRDYTGITADMFIESLNDTVVYRVCGENMQNSTGLGLYYPFDKNNDILQSYMDMATSNKYKEFLRKICINCSVTDETANTADYTSSWAWKMYNDDMSNLEYMTILDSNSYQINIAGNMNFFDDINVNIYKLDKDSGKYVFVGQSNEVDGIWEAGILEDKFSGALPRLMNKSITMRFVRGYDDYDVYAIPVILNGKKASVRVSHIRDTDKYDIIGIWSGADENGKVTSSLRNISMFDRITPALAVYDKEHTQTEYVIGSTGIKLLSGVDVKNIEDGKYIFEFEMTDIYGQKRRGTPVEATSRGGNIIFE